MTIEAAAYINELVPTNPAAADLLRESDDHARLMKQVLVNTFPNLNGAVTATPAELNLLVGKAAVGDVLLNSAPVFTGKVTTPTLELANSQTFESSGSNAFKFTDASASQCVLNFHQADGTKRGGIAATAVGVSLLDESSNPYIWGINNAETRLYHNGSEKARTTTVGMDVGGGSVDAVLYINSSALSDPQLGFQQNGTRRCGLRYDHATGQFEFDSAGTIGMTITATNTRLRGAGGVVLTTSSEAVTLDGHLNMGPMWKINAAASGTGAAAVNIPHGSAPTSPVNGDMWTTTAGLYVRISGVTVGPLA